MRNDQDDQEHAETPFVRRCGYCGEPLLSQRRGAKFCSREHKELARAARKRASDRLTSFRERHPHAAATLDELYHRAQPPDRPGRADDRLSEYGDFGDLPEGVDDGLDDDEQGIYADRARRQQRDDWFPRGQALAREIEAIEAEFQTRAAKYLAQQKRNPGVVLPELDKLIREKNARVNDLTRAHQKAQAYERAAREAPMYVVSAHERQLEQAAAIALSRDLGRSRRRYSADPEPAGRPGVDAFYFG